MTADSPRAMLMRCRAVAIGLGLAMAVLLAGAETGVNAFRIRMGQSAVFSGVAQDFGVDYRAGIQLGFERINRAGGVHGRQLELVSLDDASDPQRTLDNTVRLIDDNRVFALIGYVATANLAAALPVAEKLGVPMFAPLVGTTSFRTRHSPLLFHVRASYEQELRKIVSHLATLGVKDMAVVYQDSAFGKVNLETCLALAKVHAMTVKHSVAIDMAATDATAQAAALKAAAPGAVVMIMAGRVVEVFLKAYRTGLGRAPVYTLSTGVNDAVGTARRLSGSLEGLVTTRVVPSPSQTRYAIVADYQRDRQAFAQKIDSYIALEGYIAARVFAEGLRLAGRNLTREGFVRALEDMGSTQVAGYPVSYGPGNHNGSSFVNLEMYNRDGSSVR